MGQNHIFVPGGVLDVHAFGVGQNGVGQVADKHRITDDLIGQITDFLQTLRVGHPAQQLQIVFLAHKTSPLASGHAYHLYFTKKTKKQAGHEAGLLVL